MSTVLILGLGNPILGDDGVGWRVAEQVQRMIEQAGEAGFPVSPPVLVPVEVDCAALGGLSLMERMVGYDHVILIDAINTGEHPLGAVRSFPLEALPNRAAGHLASAHDATLHTALETGRAMGAHLPKRIDIIAIESPFVYDFSEELTEEVGRAVPEAVDQIISILRTRT